MVKKLSCLVLSLLMACSCMFLVACDKDTGDEPSDVSGGNAEGFLNEAKNWGGETVTILGYNGEYSYHSIQIDPETKTEEPVNDAFYERNAIIEQNYGLNVEVVLPGTDEWHVNMIREDMQSGLCEYDAVCIPISYIAPLAVEGSFQDFNDIENGYIHLDQVWWDHTLIRDLEINNKVYFLAGDALVEDDESTWAVFFNKDMFSVNAALSTTLGDHASIYELVEAGEWTLDKMYEMILTVDKTTGSKKTYENSLSVDGDQWGMVAQAYDFYLFMQGCEQRMVDNTGDVPVLRVDEQENVTTFNAVAEILLDEQNVGVADHHGRWDEGIYQTEIQIFTLGNALFMPGAIANVGQAMMREAEIHYGILPMPKRSELQQNYSTSVTVYHCSVFAIPTTCKKLDATCYALEAMAYYGNKVVTPEYYDRTLTLKRFEDQESKDMLDLIFRNRTYDMGSVFSFHGGDGNGTLGFYTDLLGSKSKDIMSSYERRRNSYQSGLDEFIEACFN